MRRRLLVGVVVAAATGGATAAASATPAPVTARPAATYSSLPQPGLCLIVVNPNNHQQRYLCVDA